MPELPEVEAARRALERWSRSHRVAAVEGAAPEAVAGKVIEGWARRGKQLAARLDDGSHLRLHFGMTGRVVCDPPVDRPHVRAMFVLDNGVRIAFVDTRRFGSVDLQSSAVDPFTGLGPDASETLVDPATAGALLRDRMTGTSNRPGSARFKDRALEQKRIAGLGNIAVIEGAFRAGFHPETPIDVFDDRDWTALAMGLRTHLDVTLADCERPGELVYVSEGGPNPFLVYGRENEPCPRCGPGMNIVRTLRAGRPTFFCPSCQSLA